MCAIITDTKHFINAYTLICYTLRLFTKPMETKKDTFSLRNLFGRERAYSLIIGLFLLSVAFILEHFADMYELVYSMRPTTTHVGDLLLDNLPVINLNIIIIEGALLCIVFGAVFVLLNPRYVLFTLKSLALIIATRAFFCFPHTRWYLSRQRKPWFWIS